MKRSCLVGILVLCSAIGLLGQTPPSSARDYFELGVTLVKQDKLGEALEAFRNSARLDANQPRTHANIGATLLNLGKPGEAIPSFQKAIELAPAEPSFRSAICRAFVSNSEYSKALTECKEAARLMPASGDAHFKMLEAARLSQLDPNELGQMISTSLSRFRENYGVIGEAAEFHAKNRNTAYAAELFLQLTQLRPDEAYNFARLANLYLRLNRDEDAVAYARKALTLDPKNPIAHEFMGRLFLELGLNEEASESFRQVTLISPELSEVKYLRAVADQRVGRSGSALTLLSDITSKDPDNFDYQTELGSVLTGMARYEDAIAPYRKGVALKPENLEALAGLGLSLFESARFTDAIAVLEEANRLHPGNEVVTMFLSVSRARQRSVPFLDEMAHTAKDQPDNWKTRVSLIQALAHNRRIDEADKYAQEVWKLAPKDVKAYVTIAVSYSTAGRFDKALDAYQRGLAIAEDPAIYLGFASIYGRRGDSEKASNAYAKVLAIKPEAPGIMQLYANHLRDNGKRREALDMYKRSLALKPLNGPVLFSAGVLSAKLGDPVAAKQYASDLRTVDPELAGKLERALKLRIWE
jgi:tetratricopeptide (TPR) repeat protein